MKYQMIMIFYCRFWAVFASLVAGVVNQLDLEPLKDAYSKLLAATGHDTNTDPVARAILIFNTLNAKDGPFGIPVDLHRLWVTLRIWPNIHTQSHEYSYSVSDEYPYR